MPVVRSAAESIPVTVYKLATGKFAEVPYPTPRPQNEGHLSVQSSNPPPLKDIPNAPVRQDTPWPSTGSASDNLFETRKDWPIPSTPTPTPAPTVKTEAPPQVAVIPHAMVMPKEVAENFHGDCIAQFTRMKRNMRKIGIATGRKNNQECAYKTLSTPSHKTVSTPSQKLFSTPSYKTLSNPSHLMSLTDTLKTSD